MAHQLEHLLLLQKTRALFQHPNGGSQTFVTPVSGNLMSLLTSVGRHTHTHKIK